MEQLVVQQRGDGALEEYLYLYHDLICNPPPMKWALLAEYDEGLAWDWTYPGVE